MGRKLYLRRYKRRFFMFLHSLLSTYAVETFEPIALWMTVGVLVQAILTGAILFFVKKDAFGGYAKSAAYGLAAYLLVLAIVFFSLDIAKNYSDSYAEENWLDKGSLVPLVLTPLLVFSCLSLGGLITYGLIAKHKPVWKKRTAITVGAVCGIALVATLVYLSVYYERKIANDGYYNSDTASVQQLALYIAALIAVAIIVGLSFLDKQRLSFNARSLAYAGICVAMSYALSYIKLWDMPQGGSITLVSLLPVMLYAYIFGAKKGVFVGFAYGVLQALQDPWLIHPAQFLLDYPVAFAAAGLAGLFRPLKTRSSLPQVKFTIGAILGGIMRFACHVLSGVFAFEAYAEGQNVWAYSLAYNSYVFIDVALVIAVGIFLLSSPSFGRTVEQIECN